MGKGKKKHSKKDEITEDVLDAVVLSIRKFRKVTKEIGKLSMSQKLVGGTALLAAGLGYLLKKQAAEEEVAGSSSYWQANDENSEPASKPSSEALYKPDDESESPEKERKIKKVKHDNHA